MNDMSAVIIPRSDQLNADSLLAGPITITITKVEIRPGTEQPVSIFYENDNGKPYKCCKSMARVLVHCWGPDASKYVGRSLTLYCDPDVKWGGLAVGGIRISHMSDISATQVMALTVTKGNKKPFTVKPLAVQQEAAKQPITLADWIANTLPTHLAGCKTPGDVDKVTGSKQYLAALAKADDVQKAEMARLLGAARASLAVDGVEGSPGDSMPSDATPEAEALIRSLEQAPDAMKWRKSPEVAREMAQLQERDPAAFARVETAVAERVG